MNCTQDYVVVPETLDIFFTGLGVLVSGLFVGVVAVATLVYKPCFQETEEELPYEQKYYEEFSYLEERELEDNEISALKEKFIVITKISAILKNLYFILCFKVPYNYKSYNCKS